LFGVSVLENLQKKKLLQLDLLKLFKQKLLILPQSFFFNHLSYSICMPAATTYKNAQVKSKRRVAEHGEVFTNEREVNAMLDLVKEEAERIEARFLEPACGNGNFLAEVLKRKLNTVQTQYAESQETWEYQAVIAVSSIYGVDILEDNTVECRARLFNIFDAIYTATFQDNCSTDCRDTVLFLLDTNIIWGNALDFTNPKTNSPLVFAEWTTLADKQVLRKDYMFKLLVEKSVQGDLFGADGNAATQTDEFIKAYSPVHFLNLKNNV
jgi:hypothetical protein